MSRTIAPVMYDPTDEIKPYGIYLCLPYLNDPHDFYLGIVSIGRTGVYDKYSVFIWPYADKDDLHYIVNGDCNADSGIGMDVFAMSLRPRAMFEIGSWMPNDNFVCFAQWIEYQFPSRVLSQRHTSNSAEKQLWVNRVLEQCPWIWVPFNQSEQATRDIREWARIKWRELMDVRFGAPYYSPSWD